MPSWLPDALFFFCACLRFVTTGFHSRSHFVWRQFHCLHDGDMRLRPTSTVPFSFPSKASQIGATASCNFCFDVGTVERICWAVASDQRSATVPLVSACASRAARHIASLCCSHSFCCSRPCAGAPLHALALRLQSAQLVWFRVFFFVSCTSRSLHNVTVCLHRFF